MLRSFIVALGMMLAPNVFAVGGSAGKKVSATPPATQHQTVQKKKKKSDVSVKKKPRRSASRYSKTSGHRS